MKIEIIDIDKIKPDPSQPRVNAKKNTNKLANTYVTQGIIKPIEVDENNMRVTGERRYWAAKRKGMTQLPCIRKIGLTKADRLERQLIENIQSEPLTDIETADAVKKYIALKELTQKEAERMLGIPRRTIRRLLSLSNAPAEIRGMVATRELSPSIASEIVARNNGNPIKAIREARRIAKSRHKTHDFHKLTNTKCCR